MTPATNPSPAKVQPAFVRSRIHASVPACPYPRVPARVCANCAPVYPMCLCILCVWAVYVPVCPMCLRMPDSVCPMSVCDQIATEWSVPADARDRPSASKSSDATGPRCRNVNNKPADIGHLQYRSRRWRWGTALHHSAAVLPCGTGLHYSAAAWRYGTAGAAVLPCDTGLRCSATAWRYGTLLRYSAAVQGCGTVRRYGAAVQEVPHIVMAYIVMAQ